MLKCWDFPPASLTPAFNDLSSILSSLSTKVLSIFLFHSSLFHVLIQICTSNVKYLSLHTLWSFSFLKRGYCIDYLHTVFKKSRSLFFSHKKMHRYKQCSAGTVIWRYLWETRISLTPSLSSSWSQDGSFSSMNAKSKGRRLGKAERQSAKGKEKTLDRSVPSDTVHSLQGGMNWMFDWLLTIPVTPDQKATLKKIIE